MKFFCRCGNLIRDQLIPNPISFRLVSNAALHEPSNLTNLDGFYGCSSQVLQCDRCGRLWIWWVSQSTFFEEYLRIDTGGGATRLPQALEDDKTEEWNMSLLCRCGNVIHDNYIPNPMAFRIISDIDLDKFRDAIGLDEMLSRSSQVLRCDRCGRLWIWWKNKSLNFEEYYRVDSGDGIVEIAHHIEKLNGETTA